MCSGAAYIFQSVLDHLLRKKNHLPYYSIGDRPPLPQVCISTATLNHDPTTFHGNGTTSASGTSGTSAAYVSFAASEASEIPGADVNFALFSLPVHVRNSVQIENPFTHKQISQSRHSSNAESTQQNFQDQICSLRYKIQALQQMV